MKLNEANLRKIVCLFRYELWVRFGWGFIKCLFWPVKILKILLENYYIHFRGSVEIEFFKNEFEV
jgi:hypothetical protein